MLLSIGMIVKNEAHNLRKCLEALQPILTKVESELIIADTGSTDETIAIAKEFTPHVLNVVWNENFADARNYTLRASKGEWFMFLDADEVFEKTDDLISFFNSGEHKEYGFASHQIRNFTSNTAFEVTVAARLFKRYKQMKFVGIIHEGIPLVYPGKYLESYSNHSGYMYVDNPEKRQRKYERNIALLLRAYNRDPMDMRNIAHMINEYGAEGDVEQVKHYIEVGYDTLKNKPSDPFFHFYHRRMVRFYFSSKKQELRDLAIDYANQYLSLIDHPTCTAMDMYYMIGRAHQISERHKEAAEGYTKAWELIEQYHAGNVDKDDSLRDLIDCINEQFTSRIPFEIVLCYSLIDEYDNAFRWCRYIDLRQFDVLELLLGFMDVSKDYSHANEVYDRVLALKGKDDALYEKMRERFDLAQMSGNRTAAMLAAFADMPPEDDYLRLQHLRLADIHNDETKLRDGLAYFLQADRLRAALLQVNLYSDIIYIAYKHKICFNEIVATMDVDTAIDMIAQMSVKRLDFAENIAQIALNEAPAAFSALTAKEAYWQFCLISQALATDKGMKEDEKLTLFSRYIAAFYRYMECLYASDILTDEGIDVLGGSFRFCYFMHKADECLANQDEVGYMRYMKIALTHNSKYEKYVQLRIKQYKDNEKKKENAAANNKLRLELLIRNLKASILQMVDAAQYDNAARLLTEYEGINPADEEIAYLKEKIKRQP